MTLIVEGSLLEDEEAGAADDEVDEDADEPPALADELDELELPQAASAAATATSAASETTRMCREFSFILASQAIWIRPVGDATELMATRDRFAASVAANYQSNGWSVKLM